MISSPRKGQTVQIWYRTTPFPNGLPAPSTWMPWHGKIGTVEIVCKGRPRNHGVLIDGTLVGVPAGNLREPPA